MKVLIIGAGKLGTKLATAMLNAEILVTIIDNDAKVIETVKNHLDVLTVNANGAVKGVLEELKIDTYQMTIAVTDSDDTNILISSMAKKLGCKYTIARIRTPEYGNQLEFLKKMYKIDRFINPELATANEISRYLMESTTFYFGDYAHGKIALVNFNVKNSPRFVGKKLSDISQIDRLLIVAISRNGYTIIPNGATALEENDVIYVIGKHEKVADIANELSAIRGKKPIKKVMILGGGKIGFYLANKLTQKGMSVKIIESNMDRCKVLSETLHDNALVIHGNGTDINLLEEENLADMDAFIGATGFDEQNLFMSLRAKQLNVHKVVAKISRQSYVPIIEKLGIDLAINPVNISASEILKHIRGGQVVSVSLLLDGQAEVTEIIAAENLKVLNTPLKDINIPEGVIIGAIVHNNKVIIPQGDSIIKAGDLMVIFSLLSKVQSLETFFRLKEGR
ncbi:MAG: Trk system potassium transporter TrkA [Vallitaleaceae bacterium]|jgi:trk system potassium uptake protein TrkA|nr:Trk system potassium transporter TrkA [Vallitaleaceae bacterium]